MEPLEHGAAGDRSIREAELDVTRIIATQWIELGHTLRQADLKAQVMLGIDAIILTGLLGLDASGRRDFVGLTGLLEGVAIVALLGSIGFALLTVLPRRGHSDTDAMLLLYFGGAAQLSEEAFLDRYLGLSSGGLKRLVLADLHAQSLVAVRKFRLVSGSLGLLSVAVLVWAASHLVR